MEHTLKLEETAVSSENKAARHTDTKLPEWHPFAVWQAQIRSEQTSQTGSYPALRSVNTADV